jgi:hypothetical protein
MNPPPLPPPRLDAFDQILHTSPVPRTIAAAYESSRPQAPKPAGGHSVLSGFGAGPATKQQQQHARAQMLPPQKQAEPDKEPDSKRQKTFASSRLWMSVEAATNGNKEGEAGKGIVTKRLRAEKPTQEKGLSLLEKAIAQHQPPLPTQETLSMGATKTDEPAPAVERDVYSPDIETEEEAPPPRPEKRRKFIPTKVVQSRATGTAQTNKPTKIPSKKSMKPKPHADGTNDTLATASRVIRNGRPGSETPSQLKVHKSTTVSMSLEVSELPTAVIAALAREEPPPQPVASARERRLSKVEKPSEISATPTASEPANFIFRKKPESSSRLARTSRKDNKEMEIPATPAVNNSSPKATVFTIRQTRSSKKGGGEAPATSATPTASKITKSANPSPSKPAASRHTRLSKEANNDSPPKSIRFTPHQARGGDNGKASITPSIKATNSTTALHPKHLYKGSNNGDVLPTPTASKAVNPHEPTIRQTRPKDNDKTSATTPAASTSNTTSKLSISKNSNEAVSIPAKAMDSSESMEPTLRGPKKDNPKSAIPAASKSAKSAKISATKIPPQSSDDPGKAITKPLVVIPIPVPRKRVSTPLEIPETPAATAAVGRPRRSLLPQPSDACEIPETPQEKSASKSCIPTHAVQTPAPSTKPTSKSKHSSTAASPTTVAVSTPISREIGTRAQSWENRKGLYNIPTYILASSGTVWDTESGRRVSGRRHTVAFTPAVEAVKPKKTAKKRARVSCGSGAVTSEEVGGNEKGKGKAAEKGTKAKEEAVEEKRLSMERRRSTRVLEVGTKGKGTEETANDPSGKEERRKSSRVSAVGTNYGSNKEKGKTTAAAHGQASAKEKKRMSYDFSDEE